MNRPPDPPDERSPAEQRLNEHLQLLKTDLPQPSVALVRRIVRAARWQRAIRRPLLTIANFAGAIADGIRLLISSRTSRP